MLFKFFKSMHGLSRSQLRDLWRFAVQRLNDDRLPQVAGSLTFTTILSLVPMLTIALAIFTAFPLFSTFRAALEAYFVQNLMPKGIANVVLGYLNQFASKSARLSALGGVALILTSVMTMATIDRVFNQIWRVKKTRPLLQRILVYWAIITLGPLLIGVSISFTSYLYSATNDVVTSVPLIGAVFYTVISVLISTAAFTLLYIAVPNQWVDWRDAFWGGLLAGVVVEIAKRLFAAYIMKFPSYAMVYGTVAALPIFLLWVYMLWMVTLIGALLTAALPIVRYERWWHVASPGSEFIDAMKVLKILHEARANRESAIVDISFLRSRTHMGLEELQNLLQKMLDVGWVGSLKSEASKKSAWNKRLVDGLDRWTLLINPEFLKLLDVYHLFVFDAVEHSNEDQVLVNKLETVASEVLDQTLASYFAENHAATELRTASPISVVAG